MSSTAQRHGALARAVAGVAVLAECGAIVGVVAGTSFAIARDSFPIPDAVIGSACAASGLLIAWRRAGYPAGLVAARRRRAPERYGRCHTLAGTGHKRQRNPLTLRDLRRSPTEKPVRAN